MSHTSTFVSSSASQVVIVIAFAIVEVIFRVVVIVFLVDVVILFGLLRAYL